MDTIKKIARVVAPVGSNRRVAAIAMLQAAGMNVGSNHEYKEWIENTEVPSVSKAVDGTAKVSIVIPGYNTPQRYLDDLFSSVIGQSYTNWELIFADGSDSEERSAAIKLAASRDKRIRIVRLEENGGISENTNHAIEAATGEYVAFMDHDDTLATDALEESIKVLIDENADLVYSDEDLLTDNGRKRVSPHFKPDWSIDLLRHVNYITHFVVVKTEIVRKLGGLRKDFDGAQDYDFLLRASGLGIKIAHVPRILYHWRIAKGSTASDPDSKPYAWDAGRRAIEEHYSSQRIQASVEMDVKNHGNYHTSFKPSKNKELTIVFGGVIGKQESQNLYKKLQDRLKDNFNEINKENVEQLFASSANGLDDSGLVLFVDTDLVAEKDDDNWAKELISLFADPRIGVAQPLVVDRGGSIVDYLVSYNQRGEEVNVFRGVEAGNGTYTGATSWPRNCSYVSAKIFCVRGSIFKSLLGGTEDRGRTILQVSRSICSTAQVEGYRSLVSPASTVCLASYEQSSNDPYINPNIDVSLEKARIYEDRGRRESHDGK